MVAGLPGIIVCSRQLFVFLLNAIVSYEYFFTQCATLTRQLSTFQYSEST